MRRDVSASGRHPCTVYIRPVNRPWLLPAGPAGKNLVDICNRCSGRPTATVLAPRS